MGTTRKWPRPTGANTYVLFTVSLFWMVVNMGPPQFHHLTIDSILRHQPTIETGKRSINDYLQQEDMISVSNFQSKMIQTSLFFLFINLFLDDNSTFNSGCHHKDFYNISPFVCDLEVHQSSNNNFEDIPPTGISTFGLCDEDPLEGDDKFDVLLQATPPFFGLKGYTGEGPTNPELTRVQVTSPESQAQFNRKHGDQMKSIITAIDSKTPLDNISSEHLV